MEELNHDEFMLEEEVESSDYGSDFSDYSPRKI